MLELGHGQCFKTVELQSYEQSSSLKFFIFKNKRNQCPDMGGSICDLVFPIIDHLESVKRINTDGQCHHLLEELTKYSQLPGSNLIFCKTKKIKSFFESGSHVVSARLKPTTRLGWPQISYPPPVFHWVQGRQLWATVLTFIWCWESSPGLHAC